ncbi:hypothetical protein [Planotetraspora mira]|uniref:Uncharacterized protein n=1 Tax=Planotetraspora mira TaxID=58121 RepID=A0A8J3TX06_9ACTN|nr:hypothetical protein [Planotetraspora mira]GII34375.1 hypothetical protein Pmi06nite_78170 [Planotetraspora mira]
MIRALQKIGLRSEMMYIAGVASIGMSVAAWVASYFGERADTDRADRWGLFVGEWAPTFFALGVAMRIEEAQQGPQGLPEQERGQQGERAEDYVGTVSW